VQFGPLVMGNVAQPIVNLRLQIDRELMGALLERAGYWLARGRCAAARRRQAPPTAPALAGRRRHLPAKGHEISLS